VRHFLHIIEERYRHVEAQNPVVSVILDGENAWEFYPYNGWYFLSELYSALTRAPGLRTTTFSEYLELYPQAPGRLDRLVAGSWVYGDFTTWMGDAAKNRAWDLLCAAKVAYDRNLPGLTPESAAAAEAQLRSCESSDWFWWFGDYNPSESVQRAMIGSKAEKANKRRMAIPTSTMTTQKKIKSTKNSKTSLSKPMMRWTIWAEIPQTI
jgi:alpha-amylase/alpha-mannosidase (GH57 family)